MAASYPPLTEVERFIIANLDDPCLEDKLTVRYGKVVLARKLKPPPSTLVKDKDD